ncbi:hypothetical protein NBRC3280_0375 [Acetobacter pasteurianus NBRC 3280]|nr:hypothetical protein NBRC3277_0468 [Acetobacter pasteurianus NBRC 3277]GCD67740.1 hypothetical protein NBRC3280_0375 [Acetobacter pasteurianus NBRC 3280]
MPSGPQGGFFRLYIADNIRACFQNLEREQRYRSRFSVAQRQALPAVQRMG